LLAPSQISYAARRATGCSTNLKFIELDPIGQIDRASRPVIGHQHAVQSNLDRMPIHKDAPANVIITDMTSDGRAKPKR
jgi:hypothetical protein